MSTAIGSRCPRWHVRKYIVSEDYPDTWTVYRSPDPYQDGIPDDDLRTALDSGMHRTHAEALEAALEGVLLDTEGRP